MRRIVKVLAGAALIAALGYTPSVRRWCLTCGATDEEVRRPMPGDDMLPAPEVVSTRGVTIDAPPEAVWPWLVRMAGGAEPVLPEFPQLAVGDVLPPGPAGPDMRVEICDIPQTLAFRSRDHARVRIFGLSAERGGTRLVSRNRIAAPASVPRTSVHSAGAITIVGRAVQRVVLEPGGLVRERRMLAGIRDSAESCLPAAELLPA
ncbi:hypothetical protein DMB66_43270 [Actinoplanes sp. ATCC 53533]|uniref:SRPBCC family protein n=1 Tax=Actinoplanes sp. ATCC 53533 TaxID=1288362 RepID=UPI000F7AA1BE|nr:SRPBCC family protein [Actinoplanes sp. ATCC 53533]RSM50424.1 hypothetical protein DMB66_43270 [Actinoplanes sp. ATCC 53533]